MESEYTLIQKILAGNSEAFQKLVEDYQNLVCHIVFRMIANENDREEVCQEVFIKVYQNLSSFQFKAKLSTWIGKIAYNCTINYLKKKKIPLYQDIALDQFPNNGNHEPRKSGIETVQSQGLLQDEHLADKEISSFIQHEINQLPGQYRTIITLFHLDGLPYKEIGEIMGLPQGSVKSYLFRARKLLKERLLSKYTQEELCR